jgi:hypothetical protein
MFMLKLFYFLCCKIPIVIDVGTTKCSTYVVRTVKDALLEHITQN